METEDEKVVGMTPELDLIVRLSRIVARLERQVAQLEQQIEVNSADIRTFAIVAEEAREKVGMEGDYIVALTDDYADLDERTRLNTGDIVTLDERTQPLTERGISGFAEELAQLIEDKINGRIRRGTL